MRTPELEPAAAIKVAALVVHVQEGMSIGGHVLDVAACTALANDPDVTAWVDGFDPVLLPVRRA